MGAGASSTSPAAAAQAASEEDLRACFANLDVSAKAKLVTAIIGPPAHPPLVMSAATNPLESNSDVIALVLAAAVDTAESRKTTAVAAAAREESMLAEGTRKAREAQRKAEEAESRARTAALAAAVRLSVVNKAWAAAVCEVYERQSPVGLRGMEFKAGVG